MRIIEDLPNSGGLLNGVENDFENIPSVVYDMTQGIDGFGYHLSSEQRKIVEERKGASSSCYSAAQEESKSACEEQAAIR